MQATGRILGSVLSPSTKVNAVGRSLAKVCFCPAGENNTQPSHKLRPPVYLKMPLPSHS